MIWLPILVIAIALWAVFWLLWPTPLARLFLAAERRGAGLRSRRLQVDGIDWHFLEGGHGEPLVLLHGFNGDAYHFGRVARKLNRDFRLIVPDLPGFGQTEGADGLDFRIEAQAERVLALLDALGIRRFFLGGSSMGGYIACAVARQAPERVRGLWLLAPGGLREAPLSPLFQKLDQGGDNALVVRGRGDFSRLMDYCFVHPPWMPRPLVRELADRAARHAERAERIFESMRFESQPLETLAEGLATPTLIVWGRLDQVLHPDGLDVLAARMPNGKTMALPETGHLPMIERPRETAEAWISFAHAASRDMPGARQAV